MNDKYFIKNANFIDLFSSIEEVIGNERLKPGYLRNNHEKIFRYSMILDDPVVRNKYIYVYLTAEDIKNLVLSLKNVVENKHSSTINLQNNIIPKELYLYRTSLYLHDTILGLFNAPFTLDINIKLIPEIENEEIICIKMKTSIYCKFSMLRFKPKKLQPLIYSISPFTSDDVDLVLSLV